MAKKVLIIEDDKIFSKVLRDSLKEVGGEECEVLNAYDGEEGLEKAQTEKPDLIISDLMMPKVDGMEFLKKLKEDVELARTPVLVTTQVPDMEKIGEATALGVKGYIVKSDFSLDEIVEKVEDILHT